MYGALGWSAEHSAGSLAGQAPQAKGFSALNKLDNRKWLKVSQRDVSMRAVHWLDYNLTVVAGTDKSDGDLAKDQMGGCCQ